MPATYITSLDTFEKGGLKPADSLLFITTEPGANIDQVRSSIDKVLADLPTVTLKDPQEFVDEQLSFIDTFLFIVYALLALAIVIAVLGIINTLALSVIERTREVGLLRAVGLSRSQLRRMVRLESVAISLLGAVLGIVMGTVFGVALQRAVADEGLDILRIPWVSFVVFLVAAGGGRRARRRPPGPARGQAQRPRRHHDRVGAAPWCLPRYRSGWPGTEANPGRHRGICLGQASWFSGRRRGGRRCG